MKGAPAAPVHENWQQALSINRAPNMRNPKKATTQCLLCRFLHTAKKRGNEKVGGERIPSLSVGDITVAYWGMEWSLQQLSPVTEEDPV